MPSAAEQLASSVNFGALAKATELKNRIIFTLLALIVYRLGTYIPLPGVNPGALDDIFNQNTGGIFGMFACSLTRLFRGCLYISTACQTCLHFCHN